MHFTIITPSLNYGRFLGDCLASVAGQIEGTSDSEDSRANSPQSLNVILEHLVIDGGSTDDSAEVAAQYPHAVWTQAPDKGMSDAINKGFDRAKGDWIMWLNADDRLKPGTLSKVLFELNRTDADLVYGDYDFINVSGKFIRRMKVPKWSAFINIYHHCYVPSTAAFIRRKSVIEEGHRLRADFKYVMDGEFYARLHSKGKRFAHIPIVVADFRLHGENASLRYLGTNPDMETILASERQHVESRAIRRAYGHTIFFDPYLNGLVDGVLWVAAKGWKVMKKVGFHRWGNR
jgi:glycosyltransferase involved in cell wall biosynthesis